MITKEQQVEKIKDDLWKIIKAVRMEASNLVKPDKGAYYRVNEILSHPKIRIVDDDQSLPEIRIRRKPGCYSVPTSADYQRGQRYAQGEMRDFEKVIKVEG